MAQTFIFVVKMHIIKSYVQSWLQSENQGSAEKINSAPDWNENTDLSLHHIQWSNIWL